MTTESKYVMKQISSSIEIKADADNVWDKITNVEIEHFRFPWYFRMLNIPKPIRAEITKEGVGGDRIAYFDNGKRFIQKISTWEKNKTYSFTFNPEDGFRAGYFFDLFSGVFQIRKGTYFITTHSNGTRIELQSDYAIRKSHHWLLASPVHFILRIFQPYLLNTIKVNAEQEAGNTPF
jgi:hypothetical protein